jgi:hypothetical protein
VLCGERGRYLEIAIFSYFDKTPGSVIAKEVVISIAFRAGATGLATIPLLELAAHRKALAGDVIGILRGAMERQSEDHPTVLQIG